ncbi:MAG: hypothetical protein KDA81_14665 [Planctomycetaceae bacterium]|nr:hypothetical protein [Planctomycetaceae bacterium]
MHSDASKIVTGDFNRGFDSDDQMRWYTDPEQLTAWQQELVQHCKAINRQLQQIHVGLMEPDDPSELSCPPNFRVVGTN